MTPDRLSRRTFCYDEPDCIRSWVHAGSPHVTGCRTCRTTDHLTADCPKGTPVDDRARYLQPLIPPTAQLPDRAPDREPTTYEEQCVIVPGHIPVTFCPVTCNDSCRGCYRSFEYEQWAADLPESQGRYGERFYLCRDCLRAIVEAAPKMPADPAPEPLDR